MPRRARRRLVSPSLRCRPASRRIRNATSVPGACVVRSRARYTHRCPRVRDWRRVRRLPGTRDCNTFAHLSRRPANIRLPARVPAEGRGGGCRRRNPILSLSPTAFAGPARFRHGRATLPRPRAAPPSVRVQGCAPDANRNQGQSHWPVCCPSPGDWPRLLVRPGAARRQPRAREAPRDSGAMTPGGTPRFAICPVDACKVIDRQSGNGGVTRSADSSAINLPSGCLKCLPVPPQ